ncbi:MAG: MotA/TolQ/ExbB proton channel family protein [Pirellulaceae bacterium]
MNPFRLGTLSGMLGLLAAFEAPTTAFAVQADKAETVAESSGGFLSIIFSGGPVGIVIVVLLLALSLTSVYLVFDHLISLRRNDLIPDGLADRVRDALASGDVKSAQALCSDRPSMLSFVLMQGISDIEFGWSAVEKSLEESLAEQSARLFRKLEYLSVIANIAPMVGLLGTVTGMIMAFRQVALTQGAASAPQLAEGIYSALVTTVLGLIIAIPSIGAFAIFRNRIDQFVAEAAYIAQHVFTPLRRRSRQRKESS